MQFDEVYCGPALSFVTNQLEFGHSYCFHVIAHNLTGDRAPLHRLVPQLAAVA